MNVRLRYYNRGQLHEAYTVTERRGGAVYRTESIGEVVARRGAPPFRPGTAHLASVSTSRAPV